MPTSPRAAPRLRASAWGCRMDRLATALLVLGLEAATAAAGTIRIGQSLPDTPESYKIATTVAYATDGLVEAINARGGIGGSKLELVTLKDDGSVAGYARNVERLLAREQVAVVVNCIGDQRCMEAKRLAHVHGSALVGTLSGAEELSTDPAHVFPVRAGYRAEAQALARQLATIGVSGAVLLSDAHSLPGKRRAMTDALAQAGIDVETIVADAGRGGFEPAVAAIEARQAQALLLDLDAASAVLLGDIVQGRKPRLPGIVASLADPTLTLSIGIFRGRTFGFTTVVPNPESFTSALATEFRRDLEDYPLGMTPTGFEAYLNLRVVTEALARSGGRVDRDSLRSTLAGIESLRIGELEVAPSGRTSAGAGRVGLAVLSARGVILE